MGREEETPNRGIFGYEGEGFDVDGEDPETARDDRAADRGWNIGREDDEPESGD